MICCPCDNCNDGYEPYPVNVERIEVADDGNGRCLEDCVPQCAKNLLNKLGNCLGNARDNTENVYYEEAPCQPVYIQQVEVAPPPVQYEAPRRYQLVQRPAKDNWCCGLCPCKCFRNKKQAVPVQRKYRYIDNFVQTIAPIHRDHANYNYGDLLMRETPEVVVDTETFTTTATATHVSYEVKPTVLTDLTTEYKTVGAHTYYPVTTQTIVEAKAYLRYPGATIAAEIIPTE